MWEIQRLGVSDASKNMVITTWPPLQQSRPNELKLYYLKYKTLLIPAMEQAQAMKGWAAKEARAEAERATEQPWAWALEKSLTRPSFFPCIFEKSGKNKANDLAVGQLRGSTIAITSAHVPGPNMWASAGPGPSSSSPKQWKLDGRVKIYNSVSARSPLTKSKKKKYSERSNIKSTRVSALTGLLLSAMQNGTIFAQCSSSSSLTSKKRELITWNLGQIFEIKLWMVAQ